MSITFRFNDRLNNRNLKPAIVTARQLAALKLLLRSESERHNAPLLLPDLDHHEQLSYHFDARICTFSLASVSSIFEHDPDVISIIEEAQFIGHRITLGKDESDRQIYMKISQNRDTDIPVNLHHDDAHDLLRTLDINPENSGTLSIHKLRQKLNDPIIKSRLAVHPSLRHNISTLLTWCDFKEQEYGPVMEWS